MKKGAAKAKKGGVKPVTVPKTFKITINWAVLLPPPTEVKDCPRCGEEHKKIKPRPFTKPMKFYSAVPTAPSLKTKKAKSPKKPTKKTVPPAPTQVLTAQCSFWGLCPKTKEPIIFFDRYERPEDSILNVITTHAVREIAEAEDKKFLSEIAAMVPKKGKGRKKVTTVPPKQEITVKATLGEPTVWVFDPNAPTRIVPGTKKQRKEQQARVRAQQKATAAELNIPYDKLRKGNLDSRDERKLKGRKK